MFRVIRVILISNKVQRNYGSNRNSKTYYEILKLPQDASKKDIRSAFIKLSKEAHPDTSSENIKSSHEEFVKINEAYNILRKDDSRQQYDMQLKYGSSLHNSAYRQPERTYHYYHDPMWHGSQSWRSRRESNHEYYRNVDPNPPYNKRIVLMCFLIFAIGGAIQLSAISFNAKNSYERTLKESGRYTSEYAHVRARTQFLETQRVLDDFDRNSIRDDINDREIK